MDLHDETEPNDLVIIGAGISGLAMARFYLEVHPNHRVLILEKDTCVGGSWSTSRLYDHFWTQWAFPYAEFSDLSMEQPPPEDLYFGFFKSIHTTKYLERYADHHDFSGLSLRDRIAFETEVRKVERATKGWKVTAFHKPTDTTTVVHAGKLTIASGATSVPHVPNFQGSESFTAPIIHTINFGRSKILSQEQVKHVVVVGGGKSAGDMAYAGVKANKLVTWVVRPNGTGPGYYAPVEGAGPYKGSFDLGSVRFLEYFSPCVLDRGKLVSRFLHGNRIGIKLVTKIWEMADSEMWQAADYDGRDCKKNFDKLRPHSGIFWNNGPGGLLNRQDFFDTIAANVEILYENISHLSEHTVCLESGITIETDALLCGTGWRSSFDYCSNELAASLGLPYRKCPDTVSRWQKLDKEADDINLRQFPQLANPPHHFEKRSIYEPFRLYNSIVPVDSQDDLAVIGQVDVSNYFKVAECQSMWATAYFDKKLQLPNLRQRELDIARTVTWSKRRYLSNGQEGTSFTFDTLRYCDMLLADIGLSSHRSFLLKDLFWPCLPTQMRGLKDEYLARYQYADKQRRRKRDSIWAR